VISRAADEKIVSSTLFRGAGKATPWPERITFSGTAYLLQPNAFAPKFVFVAVDSDQVLIRSEIPPILIGVFDSFHKLAASEIPPP